MVGGEEPNSGIGVENPVAEALGVAELGFEGPAMGAPVNQLGGIVLAGGSDDFEAGAEEDFLVPLEKLAWRHGWTSLEIDRKAIDRIGQAGAVDVLFDSAL